MQFKAGTELQAGSLSPGKACMPRFVGWLRVVVVLIAGLVASGCATLDRAECEAGQWQEIGYHDGARGHGAEFLGLHEKACARHGIAVAQPLYEKGYQAGLADFCQAETGYRLGRNEETYNYICPDEFEHDFLTAYVSGLEETMHDILRHEHFLEDRLWYATVRYRSLETSYQVEQAGTATTQVLRQTAILDALSDKVDNHRDRRARIRNALAKARRVLKTTAPDVEQPEVTPSGKPLESPTAEPDTILDAAPQEV